MPRPASQAPHLRRRGHPPGTAAGSGRAGTRLTRSRQALLVLAYLRKGETFAGGFGNGPPVYAVDRSLVTCCVGEFSVLYDLPGDLMKLYVPVL